MSSDTPTSSLGGVPSRSPHLHAERDAPLRVGHHHLERTVAIDNLRTAERRAREDSQLAYWSGREEEGGEDRPVHQRA
jgi:hypothetical protein